MTTFVDHVLWGSLIVARIIGPAWSIVKEHVSWGPGMFIGEGAETVYAALTK